MIQNWVASSESLRTTELRDMAKQGFQKYFDDLYKPRQKCVVTQGYYFEGGCVTTASLTSYIPLELESLFTVEPYRRYHLPQEHLLMHLKTQSFENRDGHSRPCSSWAVVSLSLVYDILRKATARKRVWMVPSQFQSKVGYKNNKDVYTR
ncbi:hypothetical protein TNCV_4420151 [Trichonephila clavipes]|nr:hypothetical protein TNCV_4420151 [Trichonephila clavipes]